MKKISILLIFCMLLLTGCKDDRLVCTATSESGELKLESKYVFTFSGKDVKKATMKSTGTLLGEFNNETAIGEYKSAAESSAKEYNEVEGINAQVSNTKNKVTLTIEITAASLSDEDKEKYGLNASREDLKKTLEKNEYICK